MNRLEDIDDLELIAALVDGSLAPSEREAALLRIEQDQRLYEIFVETASMQAELAADDVTSSGRRTVRKASLLRRSALPLSGLAASLLAAIYLWPSEPDVPPPDVTTSTWVARLASMEARLDEDDWFETGFDATRGTEEGEVDRALSWKLGTIRVDLELAARARQADDIHILSTRFRSGLEALPYLGSTTSSFLDALAMPAPTETELSDGFGRIDLLLPTLPEIEDRAYRLASWAELCRLAALSQDQHLLQDLEFAATLRHLSAEGEFDEKTQEHLDRLSRLLQAGGTVDTAKVLSTLFELQGRFE